MASLLKKYLISRTNFFKVSTYGSDKNKNANDDDNKDDNDQGGGSNSGDDDCNNLIKVMNRMRVAAAKERLSVPGKMPTIFIIACFNTVEPGDGFPLYKH